MELRVEQYDLPSPITANWDEIKNEIVLKLKDYSLMTYTEDEIGRAKKDRAELNKLKKTINDKRLELEREYMKPFEQFKTASKEVMALIDEPIAEIDKQLKNYEEKRKAAKQVEIGSLFVCTQFPSWVRLNMIQNEKWLNASYKLSDIKDELEFKKVMIEGDLKTLSELSYAFEATEEYKRTLNLNLAISEGQRLSELQKRKNIEEGTNTPLVEEKPQIEDVVKTDEPSEWYTFGGFMTYSQVDALMKWGTDNNIVFTEV